MKKIIANNKKARFNYNIEEEIEAGIMLVGSEVKSLREGKVSINEAFAEERDGDFWLLNANINKYESANRFNHDPKRPRKLLLHKRQIKKLSGKIKIKGLTLIPLSLYFNEKNIVKVNLAIASGKKLYDKRASIKEKDERRAKAREEINNRDK